MMARPVCSARYALIKLKKGIKLNDMEWAKLCDDPRYSYEYALWTGRRFVKGEAAISRSAGFSFDYADEVLGGRFEMGEAAISQDGELSVRYAASVIGGRFEMGEAAILKSAEDSYSYLCNVLNNRDERFERRLSCNADWSFEYARSVLNGRFEMGEARMACKSVASSYLKQFFKNGKRWLAREEYLLGCSRARPLVEYAEHLRCRLPIELHQKMVLFSFGSKFKASTRRYFKLLSKWERNVVRYLNSLDDDERIRLLGCTKSAQV